MDDFIILATFMVAFFMSFYSYRKGLQDGLSINKGKELTPIIKVQPKETEKPIDVFMQGLENILSYDGTDQEVRK